MSRSEVSSFIMQTKLPLFRIIAGSKDIKEIDLNHNDIGDLGARLLVDGLMDRLDAGLPKMYLQVGHNIDQDTYDAIRKIAPQPKRRK